MKPTSSRANSAIPAAISLLWAVSSLVSYRISADGSPGTKGATEAAGPCEAGGNGSVSAGALLQDRRRRGVVTIVVVATVGCRHERNAFCNLVFLRIVTHAKGRPGKGVTKSWPPETHRSVVPNVFHLKVMGRSPNQCRD